MESAQRKLNHQSFARHGLLEIEQAFFRVALALNNVGVLEDAYVELCHLISIAIAPNIRDDSLHDPDATRGA
ncbi:hypothetical protein CGERO_09575 [Corynebacterium gerontici]|uniref:Uncharacterized protein n=1 Tax=Corynebacterium gerontici TaxID=2079234 RepID=A0A3G6J2N5_9CORY|nr:hypothetical protein CGERO_09575 [Corynebacterium gerontici]